MSNWSDKKLTIFYLTISFFLVVFYYLTRPDAPLVRGDTPGFQEVAVDLQDNLQLDELPLRSIGYPLMLILTGSTEQPTWQLYLLQLLMYAVSVLMLVLLLERLDIPRFALLIFFIFAWLPPFVQYTASTLSETPSIFCVAVGVSCLYLYLRGGSIAWCILSGFLLSYVVLVRPTFLLVTPSLIFIILIAHFVFKYSSENRRRVVILIGTLFVQFLLIVGSIIIYNRVNFGFTTDAGTGFRLNTKTVRFIEYLADEYAVEREILVRKRDAKLIDPGRFELHKATQYIWSNGTIEELMEATGLTYVELSNRMLVANIDLIIDEPLEYLRDVAAAMATFWFPLEWEFAPYVNLMWIGVHFFMMIIFFVSSGLIWFGLGMMYLPRSSRPEIRVLLQQHQHKFLMLVVLTAVIWQTALVSTFFEVGIPRYRVPVDLLVYVVMFLQIKLLNEIRFGISVYRLEVSSG